jgi:glycosyltransferase involved in cell wall biosynthesis
VPTGGARYIIGLVHGLCALPLDAQGFVFVKRQDIDRFGAWPAHIEAIPVRLPTRLTRLAWEQTAFPLALRRLDVDLIHSPHYSMPRTAGRAPRVVTIHDLTFMLCPERHQAIKRWYFSRALRTAATSADHLIVDANHTGLDLVRHLGVDPSRITVVPLAPDDAFRTVDDERRIAAVMTRLGIRSPFLLTVGTREPRKNLGAAVRALKRLRDRGFDLQLAVVGAAGWGRDQVGDESRRLALGDHVRVLGYLPDEDLAALYSACRVFLYPSLYEGFGLPALEALACGADVIVSNRSAMPEVVGEVGLQYDPDHEDTLTESIVGLLRGDGTRQARRQRAVSHALAFSWTRTARETYDCYRSVLARTRR